jgi:hypothetical protein
MPSNCWITARASCSIAAALEGGGLGDRLAGDGDRLEQAAGRGAEAGDADLEQLVEGDLGGGAGAVGDEPGEVVEELRAALGLAGELVQAGGRGVLAEHVLGEGQRLARVERAQLEHLDGETWRFGHGREGMQGRAGVAVLAAVAGDQEDRRRVGRAEDAAWRAWALPGSPHWKSSIHRTAGRGGTAWVNRSRRAAKAARSSSAARRGPRDPRRRLQDREQRGEAGDRGGQLGPWALAQVAGERVEQAVEGLERDAVALVAAGAQDRGGALQLVGDVADQGRLADAGLAAGEHDDGLAGGADLGVGARRAWTEGARPMKRRAPTWVAAGDR